MIAAGAVAGERRPRPRILLLVAVTAAHLLAIWLLLQRTVAVEDGLGQPLLAVFDVTPPPPPLPLPPPPPPPPETDRRAGGGGSPGIRRQRPAIRVEEPAPPTREAMDATPVPLVPAPLPLPAAGSAPIDLGSGGLGGTGSGTGEGHGMGDGAGSGAGSGDDVGYARAQWVTRPTPATYERYRPHGRVLPDHPVTVRMTCRVRRNGSPYRCRDVSERPRGAGFQIMVVRAVLEAKVRPVARNGQPMWDKPVIIEVVLNALHAAPRITAEASAPPAR